MLKGIKGQTKSNMITYGMVLAAVIFAQIMLATGNVSRLMQGLLVLLTVYVIMAVSLNFTVGILGELSLGHAGFMCIGAFASATFTAYVRDGNMPQGLQFLFAMLIGAVAAAILGLVIGIPVLRLRGDYLALVTLAFGEIIMNVMNATHLGIDNSGLHFSLRDATGFSMGEEGRMLINGPLGILDIPQYSTFLIGVVLVLITIFIVTNMINSRDGRAIMSIRDNRIAAESVGINITKYKLLAFTISAGLAGTAGVLYAHNMRVLDATPQNFGFHMSIMILVFVVLGGIGNIRGSIIAAVVLTMLPELLRGLADFRMLIYAVVLIIMMLLNWAPKALEIRERIVAKIPFLQKKGTGEIS